MKQMMLTSKVTASLKRNVPTFYANKDYEGLNPFVINYYVDQNPLIETNISVDNIPILKLSEGSKHSDLENSISLFSAYKNLTHHQATSEAFWSFMTHVQYWEYMQKRWPVSNNTSDNNVDYIKYHYFFGFGTDRALIRNGIARLWWYAKLTFDETSDNPFRLTEILLSKLDITQGLLERAWGRNNNILRAFLEFLSETPTLTTGGANNRERTRYLYKSLTLEGGVSVIDFLSKDDIKSFLSRKLINYDLRMTAKTQPNV